MYRFPAYILFHLLLLTNLCHAQQIRISPQAIDEDGLDYAKVIGQTETGVYVLGSNLSLESTRDRFGLRVRRYVVYFYDNEKLELKWQRELKPEPLNGSLDHVGFFNQSVIAITSTYDKTDNRHELFFSIIDSTGKVVRSAVQIYEGTVLKPSTLSKPRQVNSTDNRWMGIVQYENREGEMITHFGCIDEDFEPENQYRISIPSTEGRMEAGKFLLTDNLRLCFISQQDRNQDSDSRSFRLHVSDTVNHRSFPFNTSSQPMSEAVLSYDRMNKMLNVTGFYADKSAASGTGILLGKINPENPDSLMIKHGNLNNEPASKLTGQRHSGAGVSIYNYPVSRIIPRSDGGEIIVAEAAYLSEYSVFDYFTQTYNRRIEYHYDNILVISVNEDATVDWSQLIRKNQTTLDDEGLFSSFCMMVNAEDLLFLYNGEIGRHNEIKGQSIDAKGQISSRRFNLNGDNVLLLPRSGKQISSNVIIAPAVTKKKLFLIKIEL